MDDARQHDRRANLDGTGVDQNFITGVGPAEGLAVDGEHVYWSSGQGPTIGQANIDGSGTVNNNLITGAGVPSGVAVNGADLFGRTTRSPA